MDVTELVRISIILLLVATIVALLSRRVGIPYVTGLVLAGLPFTELMSRPIGLDPSLVLNLFLPILIFDAGINTDVSRLRSTFKPIALLAGPGAILSSVIIAVLLKFGLGLGWIPAAFMGIILANTDTVSMIAVFKEIPVPSRLSTIVEGETLFNDAAALVSFNLISQVYSTGSLTFQEGIQQLLFIAIGGSIVGLVLGYLSIPVFARLDDPLSSLLLTVAVALGTFQAGQFLGVSGAVAVVVAGLIFGNLGLSRQTTASSRITLLSFWEYASFTVNTFIFLLIGVEINLLTFWQAELITAKAAQDELEGLLKSGILPKSVYEEMRSRYQVKVAGAEKSLREFYNRRSGELEHSTGDYMSKLDAIRRRLILAEKGVLNEALRKRILSETIVRGRLRTLDEQLLQLEDD
ncbi:cation:proton antiporter [Planktothrix pseudagardhii]|uniref:Na(+)/H(+) antiporter NhaS2 n=1 Tax=Planktothrix pseudagardhii TaxID=132604 RepID=A0A9W4G7H8_9CYAN|nr:sodium:proton antiporter [Planktothrix pseudagardhii]CAD5954252.1 Na(+)/H(+) antiporter NhaS2 [Planktothrix pseudagardhii]